MRKINFTVCVSLLLFTYTTIAQCTADAGRDTVICFDWNKSDTIRLGGRPAAKGGIPTYQYKWETNWQLGSTTYYASDFLDDTTVANPTLIDKGELKVQFYLTVIDGNSSICTDTMSLYFTNFGIGLGSIAHTINAGDSVYLTGGINILGSIPPIDYLWKPNHGLTDSTSNSFWAKPDTSVAYFLTLTDSTGCQISAPPAYYVNVNPISIGEQKEAINSLIVYPNPTKGYISIDLDVKGSEKREIQIINSSGKICVEKTTWVDRFQLNLRHLNKGLYFIRVLSSGKILKQGSFTVQ